MGTEAIKTILEPKIARAILSEVAAGDWLDKEIPEDEEELIKLAEYYAEEARVAVEVEGMKDEHLLAIINLSKVSPPVLSVPAGSLDSEGGPPGEIEFDEFRDGPIVLDEQAAKKLKEVIKTYPRRSSGGYSESDLREELPPGAASDVDPTGYWIPESVDAVREGLPIPRNVSESDPYDMPTDLTEVGDKPLRRLYSAFNAYSGRARWMLAIATSNLANATHLKEGAYRSAYADAITTYKMNDEKATKDMLDNLARTDEGFMSWEEKVLKHEKEVIHWRALLDIYGKNVEIISREWTMRTESVGR